VNAFSPEDLETARKVFAGPCDFIWGATNPDELPPSDRPEIALAGRSNVGKSSLINALTGNKNTARTSNTPGRTQQLNFFNLGGLLNLVDMPGYGYAKVSKQQRDDWDHLIFSYLRGRQSLRAVFMLIDSRHGVKDVDLHLMDLLDQAGVNYRLVLTKIDQVSPTEAQNISNESALVLKRHPAAYPDILMTSSDKGTGIDTLRASIISLR
jgi:GTP-binding protein